MGKSSGACFKIIACAGDSVDRENFQETESKTSSVRRGWSFRKRSDRHRVLSNNVISEAASSVQRENPESTDINLHMLSDLTVPEKTSTLQWKEETIELCAQPSPKLLDTVVSKEDNFRADAILDESSIIIIQAAVRGFLTRRMLLKKKNITKLQAVIRGYLVRRQAVGTLRCVQAIVKMQALVRARRACLLSKESSDPEHRNQSSEKFNSVPVLLSNKTESKSGGTFTYISIDKLISNGFVQQLLESTPKSKSFNIRCDSSASDSWKWMERWTSVSSVSSIQEEESELAAEQHKKEKLRCSNYECAILFPSGCSPDIIDFEPSVELHEKERLGNSNGKGTMQSRIIIPSDCSPDPTNFKSGVELHADYKEDISVPSDCFLDPTNFQSCMVSTKESVNDDTIISIDGDNLDLQASASISHSSRHSESPNIKKSDLVCDLSEIAPTVKKETDSSLLKAEAKNLADKDEAVNELAIHDIINKLSSVQPETMPKKLSRKASNPAFIAAQSKFEELSSAPMVVTVDTSSVKDVEVECSLDKDKVLLTSDQPSKSQVIEPCENSISYTSAVPTGDSECGTELSISSTLDSPDRSEAGINDLEHDPRKSSCSVTESLGRDNPGLDLLHINTNHEHINSAIGECDNSAFSVDSSSLVKTPEADPNAQLLEQGSEASSLRHKSSPGTSPRSQITVTESQTTPSSQVAFKPKKNRGEKRESTHNLSSSTGKKSISNPNQDSTPRTSLEQLPKDQKVGKRRSSYVSSKADNADQETKDSNNSSSLPSYMQATESARAKAISSGSPRSSPDVQEKDIHMKKRHSLPGTNRRHGSPHIQRSLSQAQQTAKGNDGHSPQDRTWRK